MNGYTATSDFMESPKCVRCQQPITGEDARYYSRDIPAIDGKKCGGQSFSARTVRVRAHFLTAH